jgi:hypothetical protein
MRLFASDKGVDGDADANNAKQLSDLFKLIMDAVNDGREEELAAAGLRVTKKSARETLDGKLNDPQIAENVLGSMTEEDEELARILEVEVQRQDRDRGTAGGAAMDVDPTLFAELQAEVRETLASQRAAGSAVGALLDETEFDDYLGSVLDGVMAGDGGSADTADAVNWGAGAGGVAQTLPFGESSWSFDAFGPPAASPGSRMEVEEAPDDDDDDDDDDDSVGNGDVTEEPDVGGAPSASLATAEDRAPQRPPSSRYYGLGKKPHDAPPASATPNTAPKRYYGLGKTPPSAYQYQYPPGNSAAFSTELPIAPKPPTPPPPSPPPPPATPSLLQVVRDPPADPPPSAAPDAGAEGTAAPATTTTPPPETLFAQLLKVTMDQQTAAIEAQADADTDADGGVARGAVDAVSAGDLGALDVKAILGEALSTLTDQLGIDVTAELQSNPQVIGEIQNMMAANMAELAKNMEELDQESQTLFDQLGTLEADLRKETAAFDEQKQLELGELLQSQNALQGEFQKSKVKMEASAAQLETMMRDLEENADALTALALFPIKRPDKKAAFILGLALLLKVPFDASQLVALHSSDFTDWLTVFTQFALCLTCLQHYGLITALFKKSKTFGLPPPPADL